MPSVSVCFPAYNEAETIGSVLEDAHALLSASGLDYEILVCDDGSRDGTGETIARLAPSIPRLRVFTHAENRGIRDTFERLYVEATKEFVFLNSTDGQWETRIVLDMFPLTDRFDVIIASRRNKHYAAWRRFVSWMFNLAPRVLFGVRTYDAGAVKVMRRAIIERFALISRSPFTEAERLIRAARAGYRITTFPVDVGLRRSGRARGVSWRLVRLACGDVVRVWWAVRRGQSS